MTDELRCNAYKHAQLSGLTRPELLRVLDHVEQHFWPPRPTRQVKSELVAAIWAAMRAGRYDLQLQHASPFSDVSQA